MPAITSWFFRPPMLFSDQNETVARYVLRRRLDACTRALPSSMRRGRTVTAIAFNYGFSSPTHFGPVFRAKNDMTTREYRHESAASPWDLRPSVHRRRCGVGLPVLVRTMNHIGANPIAVALAQFFPVTDHAVRLTHAI